MSNANRVGSYTAEYFDGFAIAQATGVSLAALGNAVANCSVLGGGLTGSGNTATSGQAIVRKITVQNPSVSLSTTSISVGYSTDGANLWANNQTLTLITGTNKYQDLVLSTTANSTCLNGNISSTLFVNVNANAVANATCDIVVYGAIVTP